MARGAEAAASSKRFTAFKSRNFTLLWVGQIISNSGSWMQIMAQGWLVFELTHSSFYLGVVGVARALPMIVLPPMGGVVADRVPRLRLLKLTQTFMLCLPLTLGLLVAFDLIHLWQIIVCSILEGTVNSFDQPSRQALLPDLVPREHLTNAIALNSSAWQGSALLGPTLAGATIALVGIAGAFFANAASFLAVIIALFMMRGVPERGPAGRHRGLFDDLAEGLRYVGRTRLLLTLLLLATVTNIFGRSYQQLLPIFAGDVLHVGPTGFGLMQSMPGAGTLVGAVAIGAWGDVQRKGVMMFVGMAAFAGIIILFTLTRSFPVALVLLFAGGIAGILYSTMLTTMLQLSAPGHMMGRVMSLLTVTMQGFTPIGTLITGSMAAAVGTPTAVALSALVVAAAVVIAAGGAPSVRRFAHTEEAVPA